MSILGIQSLIYGVPEVAESTRFFTEFGLPLERSSERESVFRLEEGSTVVIKPLEDATVPGGSLVDTGVKEVVLGVDTQAALDALQADLSRDRAVRAEEDGTLHFLTDCGLPVGLRVFAKKQVVSAPDPLNAPGHVQRLNRPRKWRKRAKPKVIGHVVFAVENYEATFKFFRDRLGFRISDYQPGIGIYSRCDGAPNHHTLFFMNRDLHMDGMDGQNRFHHANFGVEDVDEIMVGANYMENRGWPKSHFGLGRHRVDSALFYYLPCPAGGEAEYGADSDYVDDSWVPRFWSSPMFGYAHFVHANPGFFGEPKWDVRFLQDEDLEMFTRMAETKEAVLS